MHACVRSPGTLPLQAPASSLLGQLCRGESCWAKLALCSRSSPTPLMLTLPFPACSCIMVTLPCVYDDARARPSICAMQSCNMFLYVRQCGLRTRHISPVTTAALLLECLPLSKQWFSDRLQAPSTVHLRLVYNLAAAENMHVARVGANGMCACNTLHAVCKAVQNSTADGTARSTRWQQEARWA